MYEKIVTPIKLWRSYIPQYQRPAERNVLVKKIGKVCLTASLFFSLASPSIVSGESTTALRLLRCFQELDNAVAAYENGRADLAQTQLNALSESCNQVPHLYHNLGTLALLRQEWDEAIAHFEKSLSLDPRAYMTQQTLNSVYRYKAALAYQKALKLDGPEAPLPTVKMQTSVLSNSHQLDLSALTATQRSGAPAIAQKLNSAIDAAHFDVSTWWHAQRRHDLDAYFAFYQPDIYPAGFESESSWRRHWAELPTTSPVLLPEWSEVEFFAETLGDYMLVNLRYEAPMEASRAGGSGDTSTDKQTTLEPQTQSKRYMHTQLVLHQRQRLWQIIKEQTW